MEKVKIGDKVIWRGGWGSDAPQEATVTGMEITEQPRSKYGEEATEAPWFLVEENRVIFDLDNGHWAYGEQISQIPVGV